jgi:hypothetical protein
MKTKFKTLLHCVSLYTRQLFATTSPQTAGAWRRGHWRLLILVACCLAIAGCNRGCKQTGTGGNASPTPTPIVDLGNQVPGRDLREDPPLVESVVARPLPNPTAEGNALVVVQFGREEKLPPQLNIDIEEGQLTLHDDGKNGDEGAGDGRFSAIAKLDLELLRKSNEERLTRTPNAVMPTFVDRAKVSEDTASKLLERFRRSDLIDLSPIGLPAKIDIGRSLMITDPSVVGDPTRTRTACKGAGSSSMGKWSFGYLMQEMANQPATGVSPSDFTLKWLQTWLGPQNINGWTVAQRNAIQSQVIDPWVAASGGAGSPLDLSKAPFRLLAIVNRIDLRQNLTYGGGSAGEGRFVFGVMDSNCNPMRFTVIFEYGIKKRGCKDVKNWGQQWKDLDLLALGSPAYNAALEAITEQFVKANSDPTKPNGSALNQLRTNELALGVSPWELREFQVAPTGDPMANLLKEVTVKQTPDVTLNRTEILVKYVEGDTPNILAGKHKVPLDFPSGTHFLGGSALTDPGMFWNNPVSPTITNRQARHLFSLNTCNACHAGETNTGFTHVNVAAFGATVTLSGFLTGINVNDPADGAPNRHFEDLTRRAQDLDALLNSPCLSIIKIPRLRMVH